ncbi:hypothetical protein [Alkalicoccus daliensis]|uniref:ABC-2 family transporter protein n=1 Tax=Alkalicoccus daliensis TaxID=745820 RepID=A0A1H0HUT1_9BACI|nr:hypothetical protein [Alkalicoccus daliensis]SDO22907.1 hypothetical protein SAMN04488053_10951 [Alkalicoccus daliensis]
MNEIKRNTGNLYFQQLKWLYWFVGIIALIRIGMYFIEIYFPETETPLTSFVEFAYQSNKIFMLVAGLMSVYVFLGMFIEYGKTRKLFFQSSITAFVLVALTLTVLVFLISGLEHLIRPGLPAVSAINETTMLTYSISAFFTYSFTLMLYYALGMIITSGFYRFGWLRGLGFVAAGLFILLLESIIWETEFAFFGTGLHQFDVPIPLALLLTLGLTALTSAAVLQIIKKTPVKLK